MILRNHGFLSIFPQTNPLSIDISGGHGDKPILHWLKRGRIHHRHVGASGWRRRAGTEPLKLVGCLAEKATRGIPWHGMALGNSTQTRLVKIPPANNSPGTGGMKWHEIVSTCTTAMSEICSWLVVWNIFYFPIYWETSSQLTFIFFRGVQTTNQCSM